MSYHQDLGFFRMPTMTLQTEATASAAPVSLLDTLKNVTKKVMPKPIGSRGTSTPVTDPTGSSASATAVGGSNMLLYGGAAVGALVLFIILKKRKA